MNEYETVYVLAPALNATTIENIKSKLEGVIKKDGGHVLIHGEWGKRRLAYHMGKHQNGHYFYLQYLSPGGTVGGIERNLKYDESVLRFITVKLSERVNVDEKLKKEYHLPRAAYESQGEERRTY